MTDPRITRSRSALRGALLALVRTQHYDNIQIQDITDQADTARVTFYRHYASKDDLLMDCLQEIYERFLATLATDAFSQPLNFNTVPPLQHLFEFIQSDRDLYKRLLNGPMAPNLERRLREYVIERIDALQTDLHPFEANFMASALIGNMKWWLISDLPYSPHYMARTTHWLTVSGILAMRGDLDLITMPGDDARAGTLYGE